MCSSLNWHQNLCPMSSLLLVDHIQNSQEIELCFARMCHQLLEWIPGIRQGCHWNHHRLVARILPQLHSHMSWFCWLILSAELLGSCFSFKIRNLFVYIINIFGMAYLLIPLWCSPDLNYKSLA